ncbi:MAG: Eco57I restriction-modification methylase domain-containing protein, partial [Promethearchaeota archaeon]
HESRESIDQQVKLGLEGVLPNLVDNIKCGNSLIGPDFYGTEQQETLFDEAEMRRVNVFDWNDDVKGFGKIMKRGGFDCVIGNPPYVRSKLLPKTERNYFSQNYDSAIGTFDIYILFIERGMNLLKEQGRLAFINPNKYFYSDYGKELRKIISDRYTIKKIFNFNEFQVFKYITTYTAINIFEKSDFPEEFDYYIVKDKKIKEEIVQAFLGGNLSKDIQHMKVEQQSLNPSSWIFRENFKIKIMKKIQKNNTKLIDLCYKIYQGFVLTPTEVFPVSITDEKQNTCLITPIKKDTSVYEVEKDLIIPIVKSSDIKRFFYIPKNYYFVFPYKYVNDKQVEFIELKDMKQKYPKTLEYLSAKKDYLTKREKGKWNKSNKWYEFSRRQNFECQKMRKIIVPGLATEARYCIGTENTFIDQGSYGIILKEEYKKYEFFILGLLNSKLLDFYLQSTSGTLSGGYYSYQTKYLSNIPIYIPNLDDKKEKETYDTLISLVGQMLETQKHFHSARMERDKELYERQIKIVDAQIDRLVYDLYGLMEEEMKVVEAR